MHRLCIAAFCLGLLHQSSAIVAGAAPAAPGKILFHDSFESTAVKDGVTITQPAAVANQGSGPGDRKSVV